MTDTNLISPLSELRAEELPIVKTSFFVKWTSPTRIALLYLTALALAEATTILIEPRAGMVMHGLVLVLLILHSSLWSRGSNQRFLLSITLAPIIRLLSLSLPLPDYPFIYWYMVVGIPLFLAAYVAARTGRMKPAMLGLTWRKWPIQILIGVSGVILACMEYLILKPKPLITELSLDTLWKPALILLVFTGFLEELIFRGLMQFTAVRNFGRKGIIYVAAVFAVLHFGYYSVLDVVFVLGVGIFFGWVVLKSGSILGVTISHGLTNIGLYLILPFLLTGPMVPFNFTFPMLSLSSTIIPTTAVTRDQSQYQNTIAATPFITQSGTIVLTDSYTITPTSTLSLTPTLTLTPTPTPLSTPSLTKTATPSLSPASAPPTIALCNPPAGWSLYIVRAGDTLSSLSMKTGYSVQVLMEGNCLSTSLLLVSQRLYLPIIFSSPTATPIPTSTHRPVSSRTPSQTSTLTSSPSPAPSYTPTLTPLPTNTQEPTITPTDIETIFPTIVLYSPTPTFALTPLITPDLN